MEEILLLLEAHGTAVIFIVVLCEQMGLPVPAAPVMLAAGALAGSGRYAAGSILVLASLACLMADTFWYWLGRRRGQSVLNLLCRISLEPESCVSETKTWFQRMGASSLLIAKFVPGLSTAAPPMAGATGMSPLRFLLFDAAGSLAWSGAFISLGVVFRRQVADVLNWIAHFGAITAVLFGALLASYIGWKYYKRRRFILSLRSARITPAELNRRIGEGEPLAIIDLRHAIELGDPATGIPGAQWYDRKSLDERHVDIPRDLDIILYCS